MDKISIDKLVVFGNHGVFEDAPVAFVNDNQVEVRRSKQLPPVLGLGIINGVENGRYGRSVS